MKSTKEGLRIESIVWAETGKDVTARDIIEYRKGVYKSNHGLVCIKNSKSYELSEPMTLGNALALINTDVNSNSKLSKPTIVVRLESVDGSQAIMKDYISAKGDYVFNRLKGLKEFTKDSYIVLAPEEGSKATYNIVGYKMAKNLSGSLIKDLSKLCDKRVILSLLNEAKPLITSALTEDGLDNLTFNF